MVWFLEDKSGGKQTLFSVGEMGEAFYYQHFWGWLIGIVLMGYPFIVFYIWGTSLFGSTGGGWVFAIVGLIISVGGLVSRKLWILLLIYLGTLIPFVYMVKGWLEG